MKLTWFGGRTIRIHIGGSILVVNAEGAPPGIDAAELVSGAEVAIGGFGEHLASTDAGHWTPRRPPRLLDEGREPLAVEAWLVGPEAILIDAVGEPPLLLVADDLPKLGRWADAAVVVLFGDGARLARLGGVILDDTPPRLLALAGDETAIDATIQALRERLDGTGLVALEIAMALEI